MTTKCQSEQEQQAQTQTTPVQTTTTKTRTDQKCQAVAATEVTGVVITETNTTPVGETTETTTTEEVSMATGMRVTIVAEIEIEEQGTTTEGIAIKTTMEYITGSTKYSRIVSIIRTMDTTEFIAETVIVIKGNHISSQISEIKVIA